MIPEIGQFRLRCVKLAFLFLSVCRFQLKEIDVHLPLYLSMVSCHCKKGPMKFHQSSGADRMFTQVDAQRIRRSSVCLRIGQLQQR
ncbi:hypothetical protein Y032_0342g3018 [Ancylostoma ceylanicum]|uniref:Uncharacterized protein n=1 Tax=Ancylostoma ceylanicum TaxID=53326 RepID=A0A016RXN8_9BILA|nr:hypothetical protein Y032_0342g3018 [Ancylostoma ceylanicum]